MKHLFIFLLLFTSAFAQNPKNFPNGIKTKSVVTDVETLTIATGAVTATKANIILQAESGTADDLDTINGLATNQGVIIRPDTGDTITLKHGTGNIVTNDSTDIVLNPNGVATGVYDGTNIRIVSGGGGGGGESNTASNVGTAGVGVFKQKTGVDLEFKKVNAGSTKITITDDVGNNELDVDADGGVILDGEVAGNGIVTRTGAETYTNRTITATANETSVADGDGVAGNPTVGIADNAVLPGTTAVTLPTGTTAQETGTTNGEIRYNSDTNKFRGRENGAWIDLVGSGTDPNAIHDNVAGEINAITSKATPIGADLLLIEDSADSNNKKKILISALPGGGGGATTALDNLASVAINTSLISDTDITDDLGSLSIRWNNIFSQNLNTGDTATDVLRLQAYDVDGASFTTFATLTAGNTPTMTLSGDVTGVTQTADDNSTKLATTAYVDNAVSGVGGGAWEVVSTTTASDDANVEIDISDTTYTQYKIIWQDVVTATDNVSLRAQVSIASSYQTGVTDYLWSFTENLSSSGAPTQTDSGSGSNNLRVASAIGNASGEGSTGSLTIANPHSTTQHKFLRYQTSNQDNLGATSHTSGSGAFKASTSALDAIRFNASSGNITSGTFYLLGLNPAGGGGGGGVTRQSWSADTHAGYGSTATKIPYLTNVRKTDGSGLLTIVNDSTNGISFTALKDCHIVATFSAKTSGANFYDLGWTIDADVTVGIDALSIDEIKACGMTANTNGVVASVTVAYDLSVGEVLRPHTDAEAVLNNNMWITIIAVEK